MCAGGRAFLPLVNQGQGGRRDVLALRGKIEHIDRGVEVAAHIEQHLRLCRDVGLDPGRVRVLAHRQGLRLTSSAVRLPGTYQPRAQIRNGDKRFRVFGRDRG